jgi:D-psicose/D-tagatose/L-ribulose 3-epimerase
MKFGANTLIWTAPFTGDDLPLVNKVGEMGFDTFEFTIGEPIPLFEPAALKTALRRNGLTATVCGSLGSHNDISSLNSDARQKGIEFFDDVFRMMNEIEAEVFAGPLYAELFRTRALPDDERRAEWNRSVEALQEVARSAERHGVRVALEPLNRFETDFLNLTSQGVALCEAIGSNHVGLLVDSFHMNIEEKDTEAAIRSGGTWVIHVHGCENDRGAPGSGKNIDWDGFARGLQAIAYDGPVVIESFNRQNLDLANGARIWRDLAESQDAIAIEGLRFLRELLG